MAVRLLPLRQGDDQQRCHGIRRHDILELVKPVTPQRLLLRTRATLSRSAGQARLVILIVCAFALTAWLAWEHVSGAANAPPPPEHLSGTLEIWAFEKEADAVAAAERFRARHPDVSIHVTKLSWKDGHDTLVLARSENRLPDLLQLGTTWIQEFIAAGALCPIDDFFFHTRAFDSTDFPLASKRLSFEFGDGRIYSLPYTIETRLLVYNRRMFEAAGVAGPPERWDDLTAIDRALKRKYGASEHTLFLPENEPLTFATLVWQDGADIYDWHDRHLTLADTRVAAAAALYKSLFTSGLAVDYGRAVKPRTGEDVFTAFRRDKLAMFVAGPWILRALTGDSGELADMRDRAGLAMLPGRHERTSFLGGTHWVLPRRPGSRALAWRFAEFLAEPENVVASHAMTGSIYALQSSQHGPWIPADEGIRAFVRQSLQTNTTPPLANWESFSDSLAAVLRATGPDERRNLALLADLESRDARPARP